MAEINVCTENIPKYVADALCEDLLAAVKKYLQQPGAREKLIARAKRFYEENGIKEEETA